MDDGRVARECLLSAAEELIDFVNRPSVKPTTATLFDEHARLAAGIESAASIFVHSFVHLLHVHQKQLQVGRPFFIDGWPVACVGSCQPTYPCCVTSLPIPSRLLCPSSFIISDIYAFPSMHEDMAHWHTLGNYVWIPHIYIYIIYIYMDVSELV
jgi:hypothetical protein